MIPQVHVPGHRLQLPDPKADENFVDSTVRVLKIIDGKEVQVGTMNAFPEGWDKYNSKTIKEDKDMP